MSQTLIATPHIAGYSFDGKIRGTEMIYRACCEFYKQTPQWSINQTDLKNNPAYHINNRKNQDIRVSITEAYNPLSDDKALRLLLSQSETSADQYFDNLRKNYPIRREWQ